MITIDYKNSGSLHMQIKEGLKKLIVGKALKRDEKLPSVREMSVTLAVNPNTVQRAYRELESEGYIYSVSGKGSFVSSLDEKTSKENAEALYITLGEILTELSYLGESREKILSVIDKVYGNGEGKL